MDDDTKSLARFPSGVAGLDTILGGGMFVGALYLLAGRPGLGKTILANQIAYRHAGSGGRVVYITVLAESHARLLMSLEQMSFFTRDLVGDSLQYLSGFRSPEKAKLDELMGVIRKAVRDHKATLLVVDGLVTAGALADSSVELKLFIHELQVLMELVGGTSLLLTGSDDQDNTSYAQRTMVDGLISLTAHRVGLQTVREIEVQKHRGSAHVTGASFYEISSDGIRIYPRTEATIGASAGATRERSPAPMLTGIAGLDKMMSGGLRPGSTTIVLGSPGSGKTLFGLNFLAAGAKQGEPGLYFGFFESPARIADKARSVGLDLSASVELRWQSSQEQLADQLVETLFERLAKRKVKRLFIDGLAGFRYALVYPDRIAAFFTSLTNELGARGVTTLISSELKELFDPGPDLPADATTIVVDNIVFLRYAELASGPTRLISIVKMRDGSYDPSVKGLRITERGLSIGEPAGPGRPRAPAKGRARSTRRG